jgi:short subunit dehydrogenase-like uncharacterized protein
MAYAVTNIDLPSDMVAAVSTLGEVPWVRKVVDQFSTEAALKRLKIVQCCGFDCIPCDLGGLMQ